MDSKMTCDQRPQTAVLFLDIDGVILSGRALWKSGNHTYLPPQAVALLNEVCERTGARVVLSSTWLRDTTCRRRLIAAGFTVHFQRSLRTPFPAWVSPEVTQP